MDAKNTPQGVIIASEFTSIGVCFACGRPAAIVWDHIHPRTWGGLTGLWNMQPLCPPCNAWKAARRFDDWRP